MRRTLFILTLSILGLATPAIAAPPTAPSAQNAPAPSHAPRWRFGGYNKQAAIGAYGRAVYPKYTWGFHARELQNVGVPHGDIGILGSGIQRDPW
jgi:hypothetical protein